MADISPSHAWVGSAGDGGIDLRSDTMTTPTANMLAAIRDCSLRDAVLNEDPTTIALEEHCAALTGKPAGLLMLSGTMGNQVGLRALLTRPPHSVLCDHRAHIFRYEAGGVASLSGAQLLPVVPANGRHLTLADVQAHAVLGADIHACPTRVISLENTLNGTVLPLAEAQRIAAWARARGIRLHCDGARLWEAAASSGESLADWAACFDTVTLCFSKGLGAPIGSILVGPADVIEQARWVRKSIGGGLRQSGVVAAAARVAVDDTFGRDARGTGGKLPATHALAAEIAALWTDRGGRLLLPVETNMVWLDLAAAGIDGDRLAALAAAEGLRLYGDRLVVHYQIYENRAVVLPRLQRVFTQAWAEASKAAETAAETPAETAGPKSMYPTK